MRGRLCPRRSSGFSWCLQHSTAEPVPLLGSWSRHVCVLGRLGDSLTGDKHAWGKGHSDLLEGTEKRHSGNEAKIAMLWS